MTPLYDEAGDDVLDAYRRVHANSERTHVAILELDEGYAAVAYDIDPREYTPVAADCVAYDPTEDGARERADRWMDTHPKGVAGEEAATNDGGWGAKLNRVFLRMLKKLNTYGNQQMNQMQNDHQQNRQS